jgi:hypothetical protein
MLPLSRVNYEFDSTMFSGMELVIISAVADSRWLDLAKLPELIGSAVVIAIVFLATWHKGIQAVKLRKISGLEAIEDAVGRATEMARPVVYTPGWGGDIQRPTTIASMSILSRVASLSAQYDCKLLYPTHDPVIMTVAQEVVREAYTDSGYPDRFRADNISYVSSSQFGYAAAVDGIISRQKPASVFLLGTFEAESLILAETGNTVGAIQIAGTDSTIQLAFFIVACDYTLIGEELFAASGYLSGNPSIVASVKAQDILKVVIGAILITATIWATTAKVFEIETVQWWKF